MHPQFIAHLLLLQLFSLSLPISSWNPDYPCKPPHFNSYLFCNSSLSIKSRALSLISLLTLQEKIQQLSNNVTAIPRLGLPPYQWWSESLHGLAVNGPGVIFNADIPAATSFPQVILQAAAFNRTLWFKIAAAIGDEARAMYNLGQAGLTFWAPNINIFRDPRWGRGQETPGEDPMVASAFAIEYVKGFQDEAKIETDSGGGFGGKRRVLRGIDDKEEGSGIKLSACCKHLIAYDLEKWNNFTRYTFNAVVTRQDMVDTFEPPFRSCVQDGKASCLMCAYNSVNGVPACADRELLKKARDEWGFRGYIASDCDAVATILEYQKYAKTPEDAVADAIKAGVDINCGTYMLRHTMSTLQEGKVQVEDIDKALFNLFSVLIRAGLFDGNPRKGQYGKLGPQSICTSEHKMLALEAARQGIVLLKNNKNFLPLNKNVVSSLAVIGPLANSVSSLGGGYTGIPCDPKTPLEGLQAYLKTVSFAQGCYDVDCLSDAKFKEAVSKAKEADFVIVVAGLDLSQETEDKDRTSLLLPGKQQALVSSIAAASKRPIILVLGGGGPIDVSFAEGDQKVASILWMGYPGEAGGLALSEIIFGEFNPGGRLPVTWYPEAFTKVPMNDMNMRADVLRGYPGRTYRFYTGNRVYGFGHGLSYTKYAYKFMSAPQKLRVQRSVTTRFSKNMLYQREEKVEYVHIDELMSCNSLRFYLQISVMNNGDMDGSHTIMLFSEVPKVSQGTPVKQLIGFNRVHTSSLVSTETSMLVDPCEHLSITNQYGKKILAMGDHILTVGDAVHVVSVEAY